MRILQIFPKYPLPAWKRSPSKNVLEIQKQTQQKQAKFMRNFTWCHHKLLLNYIINHSDAICGSSLHQQVQPIQQKGRASARRRKKRGGASAELGDSVYHNSLQAYCDQQRDNESKHIQVNVKGQAERKYVITAHLHVLKFAYRW